MLYIMVIDARAFLVLRAIIPCKECSTQPRMCHAHTRSVRCHTAAGSTAHRSVRKICPNSIQSIQTDSIPAEDAIEMKRVTLLSKVESLARARHRNVELQHTDRREAESLRSQRSLRLKPAFPSRGALEVQDGGVEVVRVRHGLAGVQIEVQGVLPLAQLHGQIGGHDGAVRGGPVGINLRGSQPLTIEIDANPDRRIFIVRPDRAVDLEEHGFISGCLKADFDGQGTCLIDDDLDGHK